MDPYIVYQKGLAWIAILVFQIHVQYVQIATESAVPADTQVVLFGQGKSNSVQHMNPNLASHLQKTPCSFGMSCT